MTASKSYPSRGEGFSLIEVVLAIGVFMVTILALIGLLGPALKSVDDVEQTDALVSVVSSINTFLQQSQEIAPGASKFDAIFNAVANDGYATLFIFQSYLDADSTDTELKIGFYAESVGPNALIDSQDFANGGIPQVSGAIYRAVLTPSSVLPSVYRSAVRNATTKVYSLTKNSPLPSVYPEGYFAMEVRIFAEEYREAFVQDLNLGLVELAEVEPIFTYNVAVVR
ncbi:MAG: Uncharacterised protein [Opitutia bacterium UBA7350]|nr:MAG: Uncharacterised protein [Opitutae bacterium UBA7350]